MKNKTKDNWLIEVQMIIGAEPPQLFKILSDMSYHCNSSNSFATDIKSEILKCMRSCKICLGEIRYSANNYTMHDLQHSINIITLMGQLLKNPSQLSALEIVCLIYSALLHDIGMAKCGDEEDMSLDDIREQHGERSAKFIRDESIKDETGHALNFGKYHSVLKQYLPCICASHMQDYTSINQLPVNLRVGGMNLNVALCAILLRLADAMDLSQNRTPYSLYKFLNLKGVSLIHWKKHLSITDCFIDEDGFYRVDGICDDEATHRALYNHLDMIESELRNAITWFAQQKLSAELSIKSNIVKNNIQTQGYSIWHHTFSMDFLAISNLFMGEHLYGNKEVGLREIIQNAIDACLVRQEYEKKGHLWGCLYTPHITISADNTYIYIKDNGIGMTNDVIQKYFLNIGVSYYRSEDYKRETLSYCPMGYFGIGFLAGFMLSEEIWITTTSFKENARHEYRMHIVKGDKYVAKYTSDSSSRSCGTEIKLFKQSVLNIFNRNIQSNQTNELEAIKNYLLKGFWNLKIKCENEHNLVFDIIQESFEANLKRRNSKADYKIYLSKYLLNVEGCIQFDESQGYKSMWEASGIKYRSIFDALQTGEIEIGGAVEKSIPFATKNFLFDGNCFQNIASVSDIPLGYVWLLVPQKTDPSFIELLHQYLIHPISQNESKLTSILYSTNWYSLFIPEGIIADLTRDASLYLYGKGFNVCEKNWRLFPFFERLESHIGVSIPYLLEYDECDYLNPYKSEFYADRTMFNPIVVDDIWLKSVRIGGFYRPLIWLMFDNFSYCVNIKNEAIVPQASRGQLTGSSNHHLGEALEIVRHIWLLEQLRRIQACRPSFDYVQQQLLRIWKPDNPLLRPEIRPHFK